MYLFPFRSYTIYMQNAVCAVLTAALFSTGALYAQAQYPGISVAETFPVADQSVEFGDIISYDAEGKRYILSRTEDDETIFGIAVENPVLVYRTGGGATPVVREGRAIVNVTALGGAIVPGDYITSSAIPGKGQKASRTAGHIVGVAQGALDAASATGTVLFDDEELLAGSIPVLLSIGPHPKRQALQGPGGAAPEVTLLNIIQYIVAGFVAVGSVYISFRNFMPNVRAGVTAVGRNPRAKSSIQAMVVFNLFLIIAVSAAGFAISIAIILIPI